MPGLEEAARRFRGIMDGYPSYWGVAGGWATDLYLNRQTRAHEDLEIVALRRDFDPLYRQLANFGPSQIFTASGGATLEPWHGKPFDEDVIQLRMEKRESEPDFDVLLTPAEGGDWICRRDETVRIPLPATLRETKLGVPVLAPQIVLLFKAKRTEEKDRADFRNAWPALPPDARRWLHEMLERIYPGHEWLKVEV